MDPEQFFLRIAEIELSIIFERTREKVTGDSGTATSDSSELSSVLISIPG